MQKTPGSAAALAFANLPTLSFEQYAIGRSGNMASHSPSRIDLPHRVSPVTTRREECRFDSRPLLTWLYEERSRTLTIRDEATKATTRLPVKDSTSLAQIYPPDREVLMELLQRPLNEGTPLSSEFRYMRGGQTLTLCAVGAPVNTKSSGRMVVGVAFDTLDFSREESRVREGEKLDSVHKFAGLLAHELHNPLAAVTNAVYLLRESAEIGNEARRYLEVANSSLERVNRITKFLLGLYEEQETRRKLIIDQLVEAVLEECTRQANVSLQIQRKFESTPPIEVFEKQMERAIGAVLRNAVESSPANGSLMVHIFSAYSWHAQGGRGVWIVSADKGPGVPPQIRKRLAEPFVTTKPEPGRGLGLWGAKWVVRKHNGVLLIHSSSSVGHHGTSVGIFIPEPA